MHRHILIPTDGSELSQNAIGYGMALAKAVNAKVTVLTVSVPLQRFVVETGMISDTPEDYRKRTVTLAAQYLNAAKEVALAAGVICETVHLEHDQPYLAIIETAAQKSCDLIVMASHGRRGISAIVLGSETVKVLTHSTIPVLVVRAPHQGFFAPLASLTGRQSRKNSARASAPSCRCLRPKSEAHRCSNIRVTPSSRLTARSPPVTAQADRTNRNTRVSAARHRAARNASNHHVGTAPTAKA
jgi:nucleotide-binding universal stress UspA family protein